MTTGLRELKKHQTRQAISDTATRLFLEHGFDAATISDIAAAARVAKMTVTNYFPRKEDLALDFHQEFAAGLADAVAARSAGESALGAVRRDILAAIDRYDPLAGFSGIDFIRMITNSPTLTTRLRDLHDQREQALARVLVADPTADDRHDAPRIVAALLGAASRTLFQQAMDLTLDGRSNKAIAASVTRSAHHAFGLLEPTLTDYAVRT